MCGRYKQTTKAEHLGALFRAAVDPALLDDGPTSPGRPRWNAAPTDTLPIVRVMDARRVLRPARWGLVPVWAKDPSIGSRMINARCETLHEKPAFKESLQKRRCLVIADGFYEWKTEGSTKRPYLFSFPDGRPFAMAGLWATWKGPAGPVESFTIVTTAANDVVRALHDRMPVILDEEEHDLWLDPGRSTVPLLDLCAPREWPGLSPRPVSRRVGNVRNDDAGVLTPDVDAGGETVNAVPGKRT